MQRGNEALDLSATGEARTDMKADIASRRFVPIRDVPALSAVVAAAETLSCPRHKPLHAHVHLSVKRGVDWRKE